jgi:hypothetical protein
VTALSGDANFLKLVPLWDLVLIYDEPLDALNLHSVPLRPRSAKWWRATAHRRHQDRAA